MIESDDWGSIRMPSIGALKSFIRDFGSEIFSKEALRYAENDTLAQEDDLDVLFEVLEGKRDQFGNSAVITAFAVAGNPDFEMIRNSEFSQYYFEPFPVTLKRYYGENRILEKWKEGVERKIFVPQFHGREHLNVLAWLQKLREGDSATRRAFDLGFWAFRNPKVEGIELSFQAAFDLVEYSQLEYQKSVIREGLTSFEKIFEYKAAMFVPPNGPFNSELDQVAADCGIKYMSTAKVHREPLGRGKTRRRFRYLGQMNQHGQVYLTRNCFFEPSSPGVDWVESCLEDIRWAFRMRKPAVVSSHRVNFIGGLSKRNRDVGIRELNRLLDEVRRIWPDVEFMTSVQLGDLIGGGRA